MSKQQYQAFIEKVQSDSALEIVDFSVDKEITEKYKEELSKLYSSRFDLIFDHKAKISEFKKFEIVKLLEQKSEEKFKKGDYKAAVKALRRSEKYLSN